MPNGRFLNYEWNDICNGLNLLLKKHKMLRKRLLTEFLSLYNPHNYAVKDMFACKINGLIHEIERERSDKIRNKSAGDNELRTLWETKEKLEELAKKVEIVDVAIDRITFELSRATPLSAMHNTILDRSVKKASDSSDDGEEETDWLTKVILSPGWGD